MTDLQPGDRCLVTDPRAGKLYGETCELIRVEDGIAHLAYHGSRRSLPARWIAPVLSDPNSDTVSDTGNGQTPGVAAAQTPSMSETTPFPVSEKQPKKRPLKTWQTVYRYRSKGQMYYRYAWKDEQGKGSLHIPGGNWRSPLARERKNQVRQWISDGKPAAWVAEQVGRWGF